MGDEPGKGNAGMDPGPPLFFDDPAPVVCSVWRRASMNELLVQTVFGWPAIGISILLSVTGALLRKPWLLVVSGIVCIPFTYYISAGFRSPAILLPVFEFGAAYAILRQWKLITWLLISPLIIVAVVLAYTVLTQSFD